MNVSLSPAVAVMTAVTQKGDFSAFVDLCINFTQVLLLLWFWLPQLLLVFYILHRVVAADAAVVAVVEYSMNFYETKYNLSCKLNFIHDHIFFVCRQLYERAVNLNLAPKKMKFFFKKYLEFEQKFGTEDSAAKVKQKALEYVKSKSDAGSL